MKKIAIGCSIVLLLCMVVAGVGAYFVYYKVRSAITEFGELAKIPDLERGVRNQTAFSSPDSGELTDDQLQRLLRVQQAVRSRLGTRATEIETKYKAYFDDKREATAADLPQLISAYRDLASAFLEAKRVQVDALNEAGFSLEEYRWVRRQSYAALGVPMVEMDIARIIDDARSGRTTETPGTVTLAASASERNRTLVEPRRKALEEYAGLAFFGL